MKLGQVNAKAFVTARKGLLSIWSIVVLDMSLFSV